MCKKFQIIDDSEFIYDAHFSDGTVAAKVLDEEQHLCRSLYLFYGKGEMHFEK
jgi:hypothetical protein